MEIDTENEHVQMTEGLCTKTWQAKVLDCSLQRMTTVVPWTV